MAHSDRSMVPLWLVTFMLDSAFLAATSAMQAAAHRQANGQVSAVQGILARHLDDKMHEQTAMHRQANGDLQGAQGSVQTCMSLTFNTCGACLAAVSVLQTAAHGTSHTVKQKGCSAGTCVYTVC